MHAAALFSLVYVVQRFCVLRDPDLLCCTFLIFVSFRWPRSAKSVHASGLCPSFGPYIHRSRLLLNINAAGQVGNGIYSKCLAKRQHAASVAYIRCLKNPDDNARHASRPHKRHLDLFRRFCVAHQCDQHRDTHETTPYHDTRSNSAHLENMIRAVVKVVMCSRGGLSL